MTFFSVVVVVVVCVCVFVCVCVCGCVCVCACVCACVLRGGNTCERTALVCHVAPPSGVKAALRDVMRISEYINQTY
jgi:hypothetical protein